MSGTISDVPERQASDSDRREQNEPGGWHSIGPGARGRAARERDVIATERDMEAGRRDLRDTVRENLMGEHPCKDERDLARGARDEARRDREAAAQDRDRSAHDRQAADFERRGRQR